MTPEAKEWSTEKSMRDFYYVLFRHKGKSLLFFTVVVAVVTIGTLLTPNIYRSEAKLLVKPGRESVAVDPTVPERRIISISRQMEEQLNSELEILRSHNLVERVVDAIGPERFLRKSGEKADGAAAEAGGGAVKGMLDQAKVMLASLGTLPSRALVGLGITGELTPREKAIQRVSKRLDVEVLRKSNVICLSCESQSPQLSADVLSTLIEFYLEQHGRIYQTGGSYDFFKRQAETLGSDLRAAEESLRVFKNTANIGSLSEQRTAFIQRLEDRMGRIQEIDAQLAASNAAIASLQQTLENMSQMVALEQVTGRPNSFMDDARVRLFDLHLQEKDLLAKYSEDSRLVENVRGQIKQAEAALAGEEETRTEQKTGLNSSYQQLELALLQERNKVGALAKEKDVLAEQVASAEERLRVLNDSEAQLARLEREHAIAEQNYRTYVDKLEETRISQALEQEKISNIATIQPATTPIVPVKPKKALNLALAVFLGFFGALGLSFASEYVDHSIKTPEDVEQKLQLPTLACIPRTGRRAVRPAFEQDSRSRLVAKVLKAVATEWDVPKGLRDHYDAFLEHLLVGSNGSFRGPYALGIMSCHRGEGVSTVAANLATALTQHQDGRVLLVDANAAHPSVHRAFGAKLAPGLTDALAASLRRRDDADQTDLAEVRPGDPQADVLADRIIHRSRNLDILPAGDTNGSSRRTIVPEAFSGLLHAAREKYRFVVVDMPALNVDTSAARLAGTCDATILVAEGDRVRWEVAQKAKEQLLRSKVNILGVVINKRKYPVPNWLYRAL